MGEPSGSRVRSSLPWRARRVATTASLTAPGGVTWYVRSSCVADGVGGARNARAAAASHGESAHPKRRTATGPFAPPVARRRKNCPPWSSRAPTFPSPCISGAARDIPRPFGRVPGAMSAPQTPGLARCLCPARMRSHHCCMCRRHRARGFGVLYSHRRPHHHHQHQLH